MLINVEGYLNLRSSSLSRLFSFLDLPSFLSSSPKIANFGVAVGPRSGDQLATMRVDS